MNDAGLAAPCPVVQGTWIDHHFTEASVVPVARDLTSTFLEAHDWDAVLGYVEIPVTKTATGSFRFQNPLGHPYYLSYGMPEAHYVVSEVCTIDLGRNYSGRPDRVAVQSRDTQVAFDLDGLLPFSIGDNLVFYSRDAAALAYLSDTLQPPISEGAEVVRGVLPYAQYYDAKLIDGDAVSGTLVDVPILEERDFEWRRSELVALELEVHTNGFAGGQYTHIAANLAAPAQPSGGSFPWDVIGMATGLVPATGPLDLLERAELGGGDRIFDPSHRADRSRGL